MHAYNCTRNNAIGNSLYFLMFRHKPLLPVEVEFGVHTTNVAHMSSANYVNKIQKWMKWAFQQVNAYNEKEIGMPRSVMVTV